MRKKYKLREDMTMEHEGTKLYRIEALKDFSGMFYVSKGDIGGWVESENNLSHSGNCWIGNNAIVKNDGRVVEDAIVQSYAIVEDSTIEGLAVICGGANIKKSAIFGNAYISCSAIVIDSRIYGNAHIEGRAKIKGSCIGYTMQLGGNAIVTDNNCLFLDGSGRPVTFYRDEVCGIGVGIGCQVGMSLAQFEDRIFNDGEYSPTNLPKHRVEYLEFIKLAQSILGGEEI